MKASNRVKTILIIMLVVSRSYGITGKHKRTNRGNHLPDKKENSEKPKKKKRAKLRLVEWFNNMRDITYRCPAAAYSSYIRMIPVVKSPIVTAVACSIEGARWDYDIKVS